ncbi:MAG: hypothetical protein ACLSB9_22750 [Hydrogeniiclostridium mannosilyticum]
MHDAAHGAVHDAAREPSGAPYLGKKIAEVPLDPEAEKAGEAKRPGERKKDKKSRGLFGRRKKRIPEPDEEDPYYGLQLKSLEEYRKDYEKTLSFQAITDEDLAAQDGEEEGAEFRYLFTKAEIRDPNERASSPSGSKIRGRASAGYSRQSRKPAACKPIYFPLLKMR